MLTSLIDYRLRIIIKTKGQESFSLPCPFLHYWIVFAIPNRMSDEA